MTVGALLKHYDRLTARLLEHLQAARLRRSREGVHELRVDIKRLRAFVRLVQRLAPASEVMSSFQEVRRLFKSADVLRDLQVQLGDLHDVIETSGWDFSELYSGLKRREIEARQAFERCGRKFPVSVLAELKCRIIRALEEVNEDIAGWRARRTLHGLLRRFRQLNSPEQLPDRELHQVRIQAKEVRYTLEIIEACACPPGKQEDLNKRLKAVHQTLGRWHDFQIALNTLARFLEKAAGLSCARKEAYSIYGNDLERNRQAALRDFALRWKELTAKLPPEDSPTA